MKYKLKARRPGWALAQAIFRGEKHAELGTGLNSKGGESAQRLRSILGRSFNILMMAVVGLVMMGVFAAIGKEFGRFGVPVEQLYRMALLSNLLLFLMFGIFSCVSCLYFVQEMGFYLSLPISSARILMTKFGQFIGINMTTVVALAPLLISGMYFNSRAQYSLGQYLAYTLSYVISGLSTIVLMAILLVLLMAFTRFAKNKDRFINVMNVLIMAFSVSLVLFMNLASRNGGMASTLAPILGSSLPMLILNVFCPPALFSGLLFANSAVASVLGFVLGLFCLLLLAALLTLVAQRYYYRGVMAVQGAGGVKIHRVYKRTELHRMIQGRRPLQALINREWIKYRRTPAFFSNVILSSLVMPIVVIVALGIGIYSGAQEHKEVEKLPQIYAQVRLVIAALGPSTAYFGYVVAGVLGFNALSSGSALYMQKAVSTDGKDFAILKALPLSMPKILHSKMRSLLGLFLLPSLVPIVVLALLTGLPLLSLLIVVLLFCLANYSVMLISLALGALRPELKWDSEMVLMKGGKNVLLVYGMMLGSALLLGGPVALLICNGIYELMSPLLCLGLVSLYMLLCTGLAYFFCYRYAAKKLAKRDC